MKIPIRTWKFWHKELMSSLEMIVKPKDSQQIRTLLNKLGVYWNDLG